jgi:hypothetical protein
MWWYTPAILALGKLRQVAFEFEASLHYIARPLSQNKHTNFFKNPINQPKKPTKTFPQIKTIIKKTRVLLY